MAGVCPRVKFADILWEHRQLLVSSKLPSTVPSVSLFICRKRDIFPSGSLELDE